MSRLGDLEQLCEETVRTGDEGQWMGRVYADLPDLAQAFRVVGEALREGAEKPTLTSDEAARLRAARDLVHEWLGDPR